MNSVDSDVRRNITKGKLSVSVVGSNSCMSTTEKTHFCHKSYSITGAQYSGGNMPVFSRHYST